VRVTVVDSRNYHTFQPLLYQVATAGLEGESIAHSVRGIFHGQANVDVHLGTVVGIDWEAHVLETSEGPTLAFDQLVLAAGAVSASFGIPGVEEYGLPLKSLPDALRVRTHLLRRFEECDFDHRLVDDGGLNVVIAGGGPTGVEMSGALAELFSLVLAKDYPRLDLSRARVVLVEGTDRLLSMFDRRLSEHARRALEARGVEVMLGELVDRVTESAVHLQSGTVIPARTLVWAAGVQAGPLGRQLGLPTDRSGRIAVGHDLRVAERPEVFVVGDLAGITGKDGRPLPQLAPVAMQQGRHVAGEIRRAMAGKRPKPFQYRDKGTMATIGRNDAVAQLPFGLRFHGFVGWVLWLGLHLLELVGFRNRASVLVDWGWNYFTYDRGARIIVDTDDRLDDYSK
jgi:NADH dehydrogenase